jgi:ATP-dependent DNA helicase RecQ
MGSRFGSGHIIDVLMGHSSEKIERNGHDRLPLFGKNAGLSEGHLQAVVRHLLAIGALRGDEHGGLSRDIGVAIKDLLPVAVPRARKKTARRRVRDVAGETSSVPTAVNEDLFERLRSRRLELANEQRVPAFVIFNDATLRDMARERPTTRQALRRVRGVGEFKLEKYGDEFLAIIKLGTGSA